MSDVMEQFTVDQVCLSRGEPEVHAIDRVEELRNRLIREEVAMGQNCRTTRAVKRLIAELVHEVCGVGVVVDGAVRDVDRMCQMAFPAFALGTCVYDSKDRQREFNS